MIDVSESFSAFLLASAAASLVGLSKGGLPVVGMLSVPLLSSTMAPGQAAGLLLPIYIFTDLVGLWLYRRHFDAINLSILIPFGLFGIAIGWSTASVVSDAAVGLLVGALGLCFVTYNWQQSIKSVQRRRPDIKRGAFWGTLSGFTSFISHAGGPPYQVYVLPQMLSKMVYAGTSTIFFAVLNVGKIAPYWFLGQVTSESLRQVTLLTPIAMLTTIAGFYLVKVIPDRLFFFLIQAALGLTSLNLCRIYWAEILG